MQILIRHIHKDRKGREELDETVLDDATVTVGHGGDQDIQLRDPAVARRHVELKAAADGSFRFKTVGGMQVDIDGMLRKKGTLKQGSRIELGEQLIAVSEPEGGFDAVLEVTTVEQEQQVGSATHYRVALSQTKLSARRPAWLLAIAILLLFVAVPLVGYYWPGLENELRQTPYLPSDHVWSSGPLANVHHTPEIGDDCQSCHLELFERAPDRGCLDCHASVTGHVDRDLVSVPALEARRCANCHREHMEPSALVRNESALCVDCHRNPEQGATVTDSHRLPEVVTGFSESRHPEFRLAMLRRSAGDGEWDIERMARSSDGLEERSGLKFPHDLHLDPEKVESLQTGEPLDCGSCHVLSEDEEHFEPLTMERTCEGCHSLSFDDDFPRKQLPHGDVESVVVALEEHFIRKHADPELRGDGGQRGRRRPGRGESAQRCEGSALECGRKQALEEAISQFSRSGCVTCHEVSENAERPRLERWQVREVKLAEDWYPFSRFDHGVHLTRSRDQQEAETACGACHAARTSQASQDVLIPGLENCVQCHGEDKTHQTNVTLSCRGCHDFHLPFRQAMKSHGSVGDVDADDSGMRLNRGNDHE